MFSKKYSDSHSCEVKPFWGGMCRAMAPRCNWIRQKYNPNFLPSWEMLSIARKPLKATSLHFDFAMTHSKNLQLEEDDAHIWPRHHAVL